jgi:hypothetical protein
MSPSRFRLDGLGPEDGRRLRQIEIYLDGRATKTGPDDWPFNPPIDLYDPDLVQWETDAEAIRNGLAAGPHCRRTRITYLACPGSYNDPRGRRRRPS